MLALVVGLLAAGTEQLLAAAGARTVLVGAGAALLALLRRRLPAGVLVLAGGLAPVLGGFGVVLWLAGWSAGRRIAGVGRALGVFTLSYAVFVGGSVLDAGAWRAPLVLVLFTTLYYFTTTVVPGLASRYWTQRRTLLDALRERNAQLVREHAMVAGQARLRERQRIAQDMHDSLGHRLALISVHTGALEVDQELTTRQRAVVGVLRDASVTAMRELREVVGILRDGVEAPVAGKAGRAARGTAGIPELVASAPAGNEIELCSSGEARVLAPAADHAAYRIVQEALTNAYKHAPGARITVSLRYEPDSLVVEVVNGAGGPVGGEVVSGGQGLTGLHERARLVGGLVHAGPVTGGGFRVAAMLPYGFGGTAGGEPGQLAPFVAEGNDFRVKTPELVPGEGDPVAVRQVWSAPEREWPDGGEEAHRSGRFALGCGMAVAALVVLLVAAGVGLVYLLGVLDRGMIEPSRYEALRVGIAEEEARDRLPSGDSVATLGLSGKGPAEPAGAECLVLMSSETGGDRDTEPVFRFCFRDGKLIEKKSYDVAR